MPRQPRLDLVHKAISAGRIEWKDRCLERFLGDPEMKSFMPVGVNQSLQDFVNGGGQLRFREEDKKSDFYDPDDPFWYCAVIPTAVFRWGLFVKVKLLWEEGDDEDDAWVQIVSIHEQKK